MPITCFSSSTSPTENPKTQFSMQQFSSQSYPPCFRPNSHQSHHQTTDKELNDDQNPKEDETDPLPVIDLHQLNLETLHQSCTDWGIFRLVNHGIPATLLSDLHEHAVKVFELEFELKQKIFGLVSASEMAYFWGTPAITPAGVALRKEEGAVDYNWVEGLNVSLSSGTGLHGGDLDLYPLVRDFRILLQNYGVHQARIAKSIFDAMSQNLNLSQHNESYLSPSTGQIRVYRYPRCSFDNPPKVWGMDVHTDSSVLTILHQFQVEGLQILSPKEDVWINAKPIPNTLLVHLGDMMQAISNDKYKSVKHRVCVNKEKERFSIGYFVFPGDDCVIRSPNYKPFTYPDFRAQVQQDVKTLGFKVGLSRFKLD